MIMKTKIEMKKHININIGDIVEYTTFYIGNSTKFGVVDRILLIEKSIDKYEENKKLYFVNSFNKECSAKMREEILEVDIKSVYKKGESYE